MEIWNFLLAFVFQALSPNAQIWVFLAKKCQISNLLTKFCLFFCFEGADFKSDIVFRKFRTQMPKFGHFESKSINFLILVKFRMYPISNVLISDITLVFEKCQFSNFWFLNFVCTLFRRCWLQTSDIRFLWFLAA